MPLGHGRRATCVPWGDSNGRKHGMKKALRRLKRAYHTTREREARGGVRRIRGIATSPRHGGLSEFLIFHIAGGISFSLLVF